MMEEIPILRKEDIECSQILQEYKILALKQLLSEQTLFNVGLSVADPREIRPDELEKLKKSVAPKRKASAKPRTQKKQKAAKVSNVVAVKEQPQLDEVVEAAPGDLPNEAQPPLMLSLSIEGSV
ncbi:hypothetical protein COCNU_10G010210 [Cocos nucifera]|uniref:Uncharacterized protein n=1 Tax=Cocos nucifera TaxID=13894 RepID=A0A8K0N8T2_COCNU|nr:hypothetical protein COCNU_10G010210 [Cocos nucifera]